MRGKLIVIEGTESSGKETQANLLSRKLNEKQIVTQRLSFPNYNTPTGRIIGTCLLGKEELCDNSSQKENGWFKEGANGVNSLVASLYYAADRLYNIDKINKLLDGGINVVLDRYTFSNLAHQGGKIATQEERFQFFKKIDVLEFDILGLPKPDLVILLYVPYQVTLKLLEARADVSDKVEKDVNDLKRAEQTYLELRALYKFKMIECTDNGKMRKVDDINKELVTNVLQVLECRGQL